MVLIHDLLLSLLLPRPPIAPAPLLPRLLRGLALDAACAIRKRTRISATLLLNRIPCSRLAKCFVRLSSRIHLLLRPKTAAVALPPGVVLLVELLDPVHTRAVDAALLNRLRATCVGVLACAQKHKQICLNKGTKKELAEIECVRAHTRSMYGALSFSHVAPLSAPTRFGLLLTWLQVNMTQSIKPRKLNQQIFLDVVIHSERQKLCKLTVLHKMLVSVTT